MNEFQHLAVPGVQGLDPYQPDKPESELERQLGLSNIVKLASNENPLGPSPEVIRQIQQRCTNLSRYPDGNGTELKAELARRMAVQPSQITLGNGSSDVLEIIARTFLTTGSEAVFSEFAFAMYPIFVQATGATSRIASALEPSSEMPYGHDLEAMYSLVNDKTRVIFVANPNNPTGTYLSTDSLSGFVASLPEEVICVVDEAYFEYVEKEDFPNAMEWVERFPNLIVTRTFSKAFGLAGLRIGYGVSGVRVADLLNRVRQPFNTNSLALDAALTALADENHIQASRKVNAEGLCFLAEGLTEMRLKVIPSVGNFVCVDVQRSGAEVFADLLKQGVIVRPLSGYQMPNHIRVTVGARRENERFLAELRKVL